MLRRSILLLLFLVTAGLAAPAPAGPPQAPEPDDRVAPAKRTFQVFGYHAWWMRDLWTGYDFGALDKLFFFELRSNTEGTFDDTYGWPGEWRALLGRARSTGTAVVPTVALLDRDSFLSVLGSEVRMGRLLESTMAVVEEAGADGVHLNFEVFDPVRPEIRANLTAFVRRLRARLDAYRPGAELTVFTPGFDHAEAYDEAALAGVADFLVVQGYDLHWSNGPKAGPLAPLHGWEGVNWERVVARYAAEGVPREKIIMTVPYYGYEWPTVSSEPGAATRGTAETITYAPVDPSYLPLIQISAEERVRRHGARRDPVSRSPFYVYQKADGWYQGWYEDAESLEAKYAFIERERLGGIAIFLLGYDGGRLMTSLR